MLMNRYTESDRSLVPDWQTLLLEWSLTTMSYPVTMLSFGDPLSIRGSADHRPISVTTNTLGNPIVYNHLQSANTQACH